MDEWVRYQGEPAKVIDRTTSINNGSKQLLLRTLKGPLVVQASECQPIKEGKC